MSETRTLSVGDLVSERPARATVLDRFKIDYCCGGSRSLADACAAAGADAAEVFAALEAFDTTPEAVAEPDLAAMPLGALLDHILETHHAYLKEEMPALGALASKVAGRHGDAHPFLRELELVYAGLSAEMAMHLRKEEEVLFPMIRGMLGTGGAPAVVCGAGVDAPIQVMEAEHETAGAALRRLRELSDGYAPPDEACNSWRALYARLEQLEADTFRHIHKENNALHPRVLELAST